MSAPALRMIVTRACGRDSAMMQKADARMSVSQNARSPAHVYFSRTGSTRAAWYARAAGEAGDPVLASALYTASLRARQLAAQQAAAAGVTPGTDETAPVWAWEQDAEGPGK